MAVVTKNSGHVPTEFTVPEKFKEQAHIKTREQYDEMYARSIKDPDGFWADIAADFHWEKKWDEKHFSYNFDVRNGPIHIECFKGATTNLAYNCLDRNVALGRGDQTAFIWEGNEPTHSSRMTYSEVLAEVCRVSNWLLSQGIKKGDAVTIYLPMEPQLPIAMLACARIGAIHNVVFGGFSAESLAARINDCKSKLLITATGVMRGGKRIELKKIADEACRVSASMGFKVEMGLVLEIEHAVKRDSVDFTADRDVWWHDVIPQQAPECPCEWVDSEHPLFLLYTSGSTGQPKGVQHSTAGYMCYAATTCKYVFDMRPGDIYWCTADCGWITGHTYLTYGPLLNGMQPYPITGVTKRMEL